MCQNTYKWCLSPVTHHLSRLSGNISFISLCTAVTLGIGGCMANANGLGQVSTLGRFTLGRIAISETYTVGLNEFFGYGVTSLSRSLVSGILCGLIRGLAGLDAFDFVSEICDVIIGPSEPNITDSSEPNIAGPFIPKPKPKPKIKF